MRVHVELFDLILFGPISLSQLVGCRGAGISHEAEGDATRQHRCGHSAPVGHGNMVGDKLMPFVCCFVCIAVRAIPIGRISFSFLLAVCGCKDTKSF